MEKKKSYRAPLAQIVLLAPSEDISASFGNNPWWKDNSAWWGAKYSDAASIVTGGLGIPDEDGNSWSYDGKIK